MVPKGPADAVMECRMGSKWANDTFRTAMLNAIVWTAHGEVPANGVPTKDPDMRLISEVGDAELLPPRDVTHVCSFCTHP